MKSTVKAIIAGAILIGIGLAIVLLALGLNGWTFETDWETKTFEAKEQITDINMNIAIGALTVEFYDGDVVKFEYPHNDQYTSNCSVLNGELIVTTNKTKWHSSFTWFTDFPESRLYIPRNQIVNLDIELRAGSLTISEGTYGNIKVEVNYGEMNANTIQCSSINAKVDKGSINVDRLTCDDITAEVSMGDANIQVVGYKDHYTIKVDVSMGRSNVGSQVGIYSNKSIAIDVSMGNVNLTFTTIS